MSFRYLGNKTKFADWITGIINEHIPRPGIIGDLMCGTASVSVALADQGWSVIASDLLRFPTVHAKARLLSGVHADFEEFGMSYREAVDELNSVTPLEAFFFNEFSPKGSPQNGTPARKYFSTENAAKIDAIREQISSWKSEGLSTDATDLLLHSLLLAANKVANISGTYGYFLKDLSRSSLRPILLEMSDAPKFSASHQVMQGDAKEIVKDLDLDALYLDPPYTKRQYGGNYHVLETIALGDAPQLYGMGGLRDWAGSSSAYCFRRRAREELRLTLAAAKCRWIFLSYSDDGHLYPDEIFEVCSEYGQVARFDRPIPRYKSNSRVAKSGCVTEFVFALEMSSAIRS